MDKPQSYEIQGADRVIKIEPGVRYAILVQGCEEEEALEIVRGLESWLNGKKLTPISLVFLKTGVNIEFMLIENGVGMKDSGGDIVIQ